MFDLIINSHITIYADCANAGKSEKPESIGEENENKKPVNAEESQSTKSADAVAKKTALPAWIMGIGIGIGIGIEIGNSPETVKILEMILALLETLQAILLLMQ